MIELDPSLLPLMIGLFGGGGFGGLFKSISSSIGGARGVLGGLSLIGSALIEHQATKEQQREAKEERDRLQRQARATRIQQQAEARQREEEAAREAGALRANLAARGLSLSGGTPRDLINLLERRRQMEEEEQQQLDALEREGLTAGIRSARRAASTAGFMATFRPAISLLGGLARL